MSSEPSRAGAGQECTSSATVTGRRYKQWRVQARGPYANHRRPIDMIAAADAMGQAQRAHICTHLYERRGTVIGPTAAPIATIWCLTIDIEAAISPWKY